MLKIQLMKPAKHAIARPLRGRAMACFADTNWALRTPCFDIDISRRFCDGKSIGLSGCGKN
jgi:hypothetical protein